jgi:hypothetical protein
MSEVKLCWRHCLRALAPLLEHEGPGAYHDNWSCNEEHQYGSPPVAIGVLK